MNSIELQITIPAAIAAIPGLTLQERAALTYVGQHPHCHNSRLARFLGLTVRGVESLLHRLRRLGHVRSVGLGRARCLQVTFPVEPTIECGVQHHEKSHAFCVVEETKVAGRKSEPSTEEFFELHVALAENCAENGLYKAARSHLEMARLRVEADDTLASETKTTVTANLVVMENRYFAFEVGAEVARKLTVEQSKELTLTLCQATPQKLARIRQLFEAKGKLEDSLEILALPSSKVEP